MAEALRVVVHHLGTGIETQFDDDAARLPLAADASRLTLGPVSHYRAARVLGFFADHGLTPALLRDAYQHQLGVLARGVDALGVPDEVLGRDRDVPLAALGGFLALRTPHAARLTRALAARGVSADWRGDVLRLGPAPYLADAQLEAAVAALGDAVGELVGRVGGRRRTGR